MSIEDQIRAASDHRPPHSKREILAAYKELYGEKKARTQLTNDISSLTGIKPKNVGRSFDPSRLDRRVTPAYQAVLDEIAQDLPEIDEVPEGGYRGHVKADLRISGGCGNNRSWDFHVTGEAAAALFNGDLAILTQAYAQSPQGDTFYLDEPAPYDDFTEGFCSIDITIEAA